ncbi:hypothetical protein FOA52_004706 [Chlamydomonas sp. UWO 241]|nr:hypothetical protein FOA52_004706 [Chlamydomonas sp. UWO 241]
MLVPISSPDGSLVEWAMLELQGKPESTSGEDETITEIGTFQLSPLEKDIVQFTIGYHQLEGKRVALKKPFVILEKVVVAGECGPEDDTTEYKAVGVVRSKLLFKTRPTALITKPKGR